MASPYDAIVKKYGGTATAEPAAPVVQNPAMKALATVAPAPVAAAPVQSSNPYETTVANILKKKRDTNLAAANANADKAIDATMHPDVVKAITDVVKQVPAAVGQVATEAVKNPLKTAQSVVLGAADVGPAVVNFLSSLGTGVLNKVTGSKAAPLNLPLPGQTFLDYTNANDTQRSIEEGSKQFASYEVGNAAVPGSPTGFIGKTLKVATGNVLGGQVAAPTDTPFADRAKQAAFDAAFGIAQNTMGAIVRSAGRAGQGLKGIKPAVLAEEAAVPHETAPVTPPEPPKIGRQITRKSPLLPPKIPDVAYAPKAKLGVDSTGQKILATTEYNSKTGKAIIYYSKSLDSNPELRQTVLDHEEGHVLDKRVNAGRNLSAELQNPTQNASTLHNTLGPFARETGQTVNEAATKLAADIETLSEGHGSSPAEKFANAYAKYRQDPAAAAKDAPTFDSFMQHAPIKNEPLIIKTNLTPKTLRKPRVKTQEPISAKTAKEEQVQTKEAPAKLTKKAEAKAEPKPLGETNRYAAFPKKTVVPSDESALMAYKGIHPENIVHFNQGANPRVTLIVPAKIKEAIEIGSKISSQDLGKVKTGRSMLETYASQNKISVQEARTKVLQIYKDSKITAKAGAEKNNQVILNTIEGGKIPKEKPVKTAQTKGKFTKKEPTTIKTAPPKYEATPKIGTGRIAATGLRTGKGVNTKSFNASKINAPAEVEDLFTKLGSENKNFASQRLSKGNQDIKDLARLTGLTEDELLAAKPGSIANSETATAARQLVLSKAEELLNTLKGIDVSTATPDQLKQIKDSYVKLVSMQKAVAGFRTEASNVFRSFGIELAAGENATLEELAGLLKQAGVASEGDISVFANKVAKQSTLSKFGKVREGALATWYAAILSGPKTTVRNILSTSSNILTELAAKVVNPAQWKEVIPSVTGLLRGLKMGLGEAREVLKGSPTSGKFADTGADPLKPQIFTGKMATYGTIVESVGRFLNAQDKLLSAGAREMERASLKARGLEVSKAVEDAVTKSYAERTVYHGKPTGTLIAGLREGAHAIRKKFPAAKFIIPFVDTVANVMDRQFDYFPITAALRLKNSVVGEQATRIIKDYGLKEADRSFIEQRIRDQQVGRLVLGTIVSGGAFALAAGGRVSGNGPSNYSEKEELMRTGWRPNSIKVGDTWVPYTYLGPLSGILSMAGNVSDKIKYDDAPGKDLTALIGNGLVGWTQTELDQSFLSGVADLFDVATGGVTPQSYLDRFLTGLVPIPAAYSQTKDMIWRQQYQTHGIVDGIRQKLGLTSGLQPKLDQFGEPMTSDLIYGISPSSENASKVDRFLISNDLVVYIPLQSQQYSIPGTQKEKRKLTPEEYTKYVRESGQRIYTELDRRIEELSNMSADNQKKTVQASVDRIRTQVRGQMLRAE